MIQQLLAPVGDNLLLSFLVAAIPLAVVLVLLGVVRRPAWQASSAGLVVAILIAVAVWKIPLGLTLNSAAAGVTFALWPVMWIVFNALILYNIAVKSGRFDAFRTWVINHLPNDRRVVLVVVGFCVGALLEGVAGFGAPVAITSALLIALGFPALQAITFTLIFNTAPVAFGSLGVPVTTLGTVTQLSDVTLGAMIGRQLPFLALLLPFYVVGVYAGMKSVRRLWPVLLVAGGSFGLGQFVASNYLSYTLTDVISSLTCLVCTIGMLKIWPLPHDPEFALDQAAVAAEAKRTDVPPWQGWLPWLILVGTVIIWTTLKINLIGQIPVEWPGLHNEIFVTIYGRPYAAIWTFQPFANGTAIVAATLITAALLRVSVRDCLASVKEAAIQLRLAVVTVTMIVALAYVMNYSGMTYTLGMAAASAGFLFPLLSAFLGWIAVFLSGSDTAGNALFGNLQVVAARQLGLDPTLMAATNSSGGVMGKMISPQNIATGASVTDLKGREGEILARTFKHSVILTLLLGLLVMLQQYVFPWMIPG